LADASGDLGPIVLGTEQVAGGASVDFTGIPSWVKRITVLFNGISGTTTAGTYLVRMGTGSVQATGYFGVGLAISGGTTSTATQTTGIYAGSSGSTAGSLIYGTVVLTKVSASTNTWHGVTNMARDDTSDVLHGGFGTIALNSVLDTLSIVLTTGTFDAGSINIMYE
jgi:hypothetical protein